MRRFDDPRKARGIGMLFEIGGRGACDPRSRLQSARILRGHL